MASSSSACPLSSQVSPSPWWREPFMWLVLGGPVVVVCASMLTLAIAIARPDPVVGSGGRPGAGAGVSGGGAPRSVGQSSALEPALKARNHAATGGVSDEQR